MRVYLEQSVFTTRADVTMADDSLDEVTAPFPRLAGRLKEALGKTVPGKTVVGRKKGFHAVPKRIPISSLPAHLWPVLLTVVPIGGEDVPES